MKKIFDNDLKECLHVLKNGGTILYPTDTVWGVGCDATNNNAAKKIFEIKSRPANKSFIILMDSFDRLKKYVKNIDDRIIEFINEQEKPTTIIYQNVIDLAESVINTDFSVAIRICKDEFCKTLIEEFDKPIVSTSANKSGEETPKYFSEIDKNIIAEVDYVVQYRQNDNTIASPSKIVKWNGENFAIIRP